MGFIADTFHKSGQHPGNIGSGGGNAKPHHGRIENWRIVPARSYCIVIGRFLDHPILGKHGGESTSSAIVSFDPFTGEVETQHSRYRLVM